MKAPFSRVVHLLSAVLRVRGAISNPAPNCGMHQAPVETLSQGPTRKPRYTSVFRLHSDTQAVPAFHCARMLKGIFFEMHALKTQQHAVCQCLRTLPKRERFFKVRFDTRLPDLKTPRFHPSKLQKEGHQGHLQRISCEVRCGQKLD